MTNLWKSIQETGLAEDTASSKAAILACSDSTATSSPRSRIVCEVIGTCSWIDVCLFGLWIENVI